METIAIPTKESKKKETAKKIETIVPLVNGKEYSHVGLLFLSEEFHIVFMNQEAQNLMDHLKGQSNGTVPTEDIPLGILDLINDLIEMQNRFLTSGECTTLQCRRLTGIVPEQVLLRGFVFPDGSGILSRHFLVILEKIVISNEKGATRGINFPKRYGLTERQKTIVRYVTTGLTNKQIADELGISVYTVKEHIKHVMRKTDTNTRTAAIARLTRRKPLVRRQTVTREINEMSVVKTPEQPSLFSQLSDKVN